LRSTGKLLSGAAFNAGLSMFSQLVNPTVDKVDASNSRDSKQN
jgi:hypothetical protein